MLGAISMSPSKKTPPSLCCLMPNHLEPLPSLALLDGDQQPKQGRRQLAEKSWFFVVVFESSKANNLKNKILEFFTSWSLWDAKLTDQISFKKIIFVVVSLDFQKSLLKKGRGRTMQEG